ncbi:Pathogenesis-related transcriptional factor and ERF protein [Lewinella sp. W8]|uniref:Pathogenesis-related transcriptional factor and ERF protein n=1 Tax=Lewinella sp. W8 TaxID=2528208 RepID=UPI001067CEC9|nr:Pathogenesis-related transcriptional factor and ERF protein [Lewinella sp. W8]MTB49842.1 Pathogenesis-related transcriptional factor and ERF protein [Lewinella sp. W8]
MVKSIQLKNSEDQALLDQQVYEELRQDPHLKEVDFFQNLRRHSSGCVVFQKTYKRSGKEKGYRTETIYLHKLIAERYLSDNRVGKNNLVGAKNGNKMDCRLDNLEYRSRSVASRKRKSSSKLGYTGVYKENNRYRAVISVERRSVHIGMFATAEEAALAYNKKSLELYGEFGKINVIRPHAASGDDQSSSAQPPFGRKTSSPDGGEAGMVSDK